MTERRAQLLQHLLPLPVPEFGKPWLDGAALEITENGIPALIGLLSGYALPNAGKAAKSSRNAA